MFLRAGNIIEADIICRHFIAYCYLNINKKERAYELFQSVSDLCDRKNYKWFFLMNLDWLMGNEVALERKSFTEIKNIYEEALVKAKKIKDNYTIQKFLLSLIRKGDFVNQEAYTLNYLHELLQLSKQPSLSARQKFRNFNRAIPIFALSQFHSFAREVVLESVALAEPMSDTVFTINAQINTAIVYMQTNDFDMAEEWLNQVQKKTEGLEEKTRQITLVRIFTQMGHLEKKKNNLRGACEYYDKSLRILEKFDAPILLYETKKSRLAAYQQIGNDKEVEKDIYPTMKLAEKYRDKILDEQDRNKFFDNEQDIYDIAIEHNLRAKKFKEAYDLSESSNSRSLLDWLAKGKSISIDNKKAHIVFNQSSKPLKIDQIRKKLMSNVQLLQYSVLDEKVVIWVITKENFFSVWSETSSTGLKDDVQKYLEAINRKQSAEELSHKLYRLLIAPALPYLDKDKEICIIPDKILFQLPFSSLISNDNRYVLEDFTLVYSPSANVFTYSTEKARAFSEKNKNRENLLSVGNPAFDPERFPGLKNLPEAEIEARKIVENYPDSATLIREEATKSAFQAAYQKFEVIHFAGHYLVQPEFPMLSKLVMAKSHDTEKAGFLTNMELLGSRLPRAKLVILSACQTGNEKYSSGEGLIGLSRTFLSLGVPVVVASNWNVDSDASKELMINFHYLRRQKNLSTSQALRRAQLEMLRSSTGKFQSPYFWAGFSVFGGSASY